MGGLGEYRGVVALPRGTEVALAQSGPGGGRASPTGAGAALRGPALLWGSGVLAAA